jgi:ankyrin repeat protein
MEPGSTTARFEAAADAIVDGDLAALRAAIDADPALVRATSKRHHHATLLHYVAANGIEDFRQRTPANIVEVTRFLLASGAEVDAPNDDYAGGGTALGLVATSIHPCNAGVQIALMEILVAAGARVEGLPGGWRPMDAAVANGCPEAAAWLADNGARVTLISAAALGRIDRLEAELEGATRPDLEQAFILASGYGHTAAAELLLDRGVDIDAGNGRAMRLALQYGHDATVEMLRARGAARFRRS